MGNSKGKQVRINERQSKPPDVIEKYLNRKEWMTEIAKHETANSELPNNFDEYELFINYLMYPQKASNFYISIIVRLIKHYVSDISVARIFDTNNMSNDFQFYGVQLTITLHPITGDIYIVDEYIIYKLNNINGKLQIIAKIPDHYNKSLDTKDNKKKSNKYHDKKITDLTFNSDGSHMLCLINNDINCYIYYIDYDNDNKQIDEKIIHYQIYDTMTNILKYDFNYDYRMNNWRFNDFVYGLIGNDIGKNNKSTKSRKSKQYVINPYTNDLWILNDCDLYRIPFEYVSKIQEINQLNYDRLSHKNMDEKKDENMEEYDVWFYERKRMVLQQELQQIAIKGEKINLKAFIYELNEYHYQSLKTNKILAFDIDKYYNGIYIITDKKILYRMEMDETADDDSGNRCILCRSIPISYIEPSISVYIYGEGIVNIDNKPFLINVRPRDTMSCIEAQIYCLTNKVVVVSFNGFVVDKEKSLKELGINDGDTLKVKLKVHEIPLYTYHSYQVPAVEPTADELDKYGFMETRILEKQWKITHTISLREVLPDGLPMGKYIIRYDSINGRIIIADNYKIQSLFI